MKSCLATILTVVLLTTGAMAAPVPGRPAPDFSGVTARGETITLADFAGKPVILEWTNHDCPFVRKHYGTGNMQRLQSKLTEAGAVWISVISSAPGEQGHVSADEAIDIATRNASWATHIVLDPEGTIGRLYEAKTTPHMFLIAPDGHIAFMGAIDDQPSTRHETVEGAENYLLAAWQSLAAGEPVADPATKPYGCKVYYGD